MTRQVDTAFDRTFSEPPAVAVSESRTHCGSCHEPLDPSVVHKCAGNKEWEPEIPQASMPDLSNYTGVCPTCQGAKGKTLESGEIEPCTHCGGAGVIG